MKTRLRSAAVGLTCVAALAGCNGPAQQAAAVVAASVSPQALSTMRTTCDRAAPLLAIAQGLSVVPEAKVVAGFVAPFCTALAAGQVPATADANSLSWLEKNLAGLRVMLPLTF